MLATMNKPAEIPRLKGYLPPCVSGSYRRCPIEISRDRNSLPDPQSIIVCFGKQVATDRIASDPSVESTLQQGGAAAIGCVG